MGLVVPEVESSFATTCRPPPPVWRSAFGWLSEDSHPTGLAQSCSSPCVAEAISHQWRLFGGDVILLMERL